VLDQPIRISEKYGHQLNAELRATPEFAALRDVVARAIVVDPATL
jgi:hypothetical protein